MNVVIHVILQNLNAELFTDTIARVKASDLIYMQDYVFLFPHFYHQNCIELMHPLLMRL